MKGSILLAAAVVLAAGCNILEDGFFSGQRREPRVPGQRPEVPGATAGDSSGTGGSHIPPKPDTIIYCSAVRCPDDYDWQRDTACNTATCEVLLYKDGKEILCIPAGRGSCVSPAPDRHHIIDGHLFTEYCTLGETVICRDGEEVLRFKGNEILEGLVCRDGHVHTLSRKRDGTGYTYREDGEILLAQGSISIFGGFDNPAYPATGALYADGDNVVFCYKSLGHSPVCHSVINGQDKELDLPGTGTLDVRISGGATLKAAALYQDTRWLEASVVTGSRYVIAGTVTGWTCAIARDKTIYERLCKGEAPVYCSEQKAVAVTCDEEGVVSVHYSTLIERRYEGTWHLFTTDCCAMVGDELLVGLSPKERGGRAKLCLGTKTYKLDGLGNGFITGVAGTISLPNQDGGIRPQVQ